MRKTLLKGLSDLVPPLPPGRFAHFERAAAHPFRHDAEGFAWANAWWLAEASLLAYARPEDATTAFAAAGLPARFIEAPSVRRGAQCYLLETPRAAFFVFRGTQLWRHDVPGRQLRGIVQDWVTDARFFLKDCGDDDGRCAHSGFLESLDEIWPQIRREVERIGSSRPVWITGHSLGGALATLAADRVSRRHPEVELRDLYTFGAPLVGNAAFRDGLQGARFRTYRIVHDSDLIARVPLVAGRIDRLSLPGRFHHAGQLLFLDDDGVHRPGRGGMASLQEIARKRLRNVLRLAMSLRVREILRLRRLSQAAELADAEALEWVLALVGDDLTDHAPYLYAVHVWNNYVASLPAQR